MPNALDRMLALAASRVPLFREGWGDRALLESLAETGLRFPSPAPIHIRWEREATLGGVRLRRGVFRSTAGAGGLGLPSECHEARVELILPAGATDATPVCVHFAATGDEGLARRRWWMALPLARRGVGALLLENAFYGKRRPAGQRRFCLRRVQDLWAMCGATILEGLALVEWLRATRRAPVGLSGVSMGGSMAAAVAALTPEPVAAVPCVTPHSGAAVFADGLLSRACAWPALDAELGGPGRGRAHLRALLAMTDLRHLPPPVLPEAAVLVAARHDACVPPWSTELLHAHWRGAALRWVNGGHTGAFLFHRRAFQDAIVDAFRALARERPRPGPVRVASGR